MRETGLALSFLPFFSPFILSLFHGVLSPLISAPFLAFRPPVARPPADYVEETASFAPKKRNQLLETVITAFMNPSLEDADESRPP